MPITAIFLAAYCFFPVGAAGGATLPWRSDSSSGARPCFPSAYFFVDVAQAESTKRFSIVKVGFASPAVDVR
ncbi:hypothetical protein EGY12_16975 [Serratia sp. FDAARGOS_506]|nr:hypothetical protein EGY12_16975 [Serratia sp. FDAARGOS_506]